MANPVLRFLITAKDEATASFGKLFRYLDDNTKVISGKIRAAFSNLFSPQDTAAASFEEQMQRIQSVMRASEGDFKALEAAAMEMGRTTRFTATEAAQGLEILAKAGFSSTEAIDALPSVLALAQGQSISMADAASYMSDTLTQFGLSAEESARAASVLAKAANSANLDVNDISQSLKYVATDANLAGLSLEQTAAILDVLAKAGLRADMAGTALRDLLKDTANPASEARKALAGLGIETNDLISVIQQLGEKGIQSSAAIQEYGIRSAGAMEILVKAGVPKIKEFTENLTGIGDYAEQARKIMDDNLKGSIFGLQSAWEGASIALQKPVLEPLAAAIKGVAEQLNQFTSSGTLQAIGEGLAEAFKSAGTAVVNFLKGFNWQTAKQDTLDAVAAIRKSLSDFSVTTENITAGLNVFATTVSVIWNTVTLTVKSAATIIMGVVAVIGTSIESLAFGLNKVGLVSDSAFSAISKMAESSRESVTRLRDSAADDLADLGNAMGLTGKEAVTAAEKTKALADAGKDLKASVPAAELQTYATDLGLLKTRLEEARTSQETTNGALSGAAQFLEIANQGYRDGTISVDGLKIAQDAYFEALRNSRVAGEAATEAERAYRQAVEDANTGKQESIKTEGDLAQQRKVTQSVIDDTRAAYERMSAAEQEALKQRKAGAISEQEYNATRQQAKQALDAYNTALARQAEQAGNALSTAIAQREAQVKLNETQAVAAEIAVARAKADGDAGVYAEKLIAQTQQRIQGAVDLASKMEVEAQRAQEVANADSARYEAAAKNAAIAPQAIQQLAEIAAQSAAAAKNKRAEADSSNIKRDALLAEINAQDQSIELVSKAEELAKRATVVDREVAQAKVDVAQKAVAVARALGDEGAMREAGNQLLEAEKELAKVNAREKRAVADAAQAVVDALVKQANADEVVTKQEQQGIDVAKKLAQGKELLAEAADKAANADQRSIGPVGQLINLYDKRATAAGREKDAIERSYNSKIRDLQVEQDQAAAKGDLNRVAELAIEIKQAEADQAQAVADATRVELQAQIDLIEAKKLAITFEEKLTEAGQEKLAQMDEEIAKLRDVIDASQDAADSKRAEADAQREAGDAAEDAGDKASDAMDSASESTGDLSIAYAKLGNAVAIAFGTRGISLFNEIITQIQANIEEANVVAEKLGREGIGSIGANAFNAAQSVEYMATQLEESESHLNAAAHAAAQNLRSALQQAREEATGLRDDLAGMAEDFRREILQLKGDQRALLDLEYQDTLAKLEDLHKRAGQISDAEYREALHQANELHRLKMAQLDDEDNAAKNTSGSIGAAADQIERFARAAPDVERVAGAMRSMGDVDLERVVAQSGALKTNLAAMNEVL